MSKEGNLRCPHCDTEFNGYVCPGCGWHAYSRLNIVGQTGQTTSFGMSSKVGRKLIEKLCGDDARFANQDAQFLIERPDRSSWYALPSKSVNPTFLNGKPLEGRTKLNNGDILSIGPARARMAVSIEE